MSRCIAVDDRLNTRKQRNLDNTEQQDFNYAGWALETFNWYQPDGNSEDEEKDYREIRSRTDISRHRRAKLMLRGSIDNMLKDFEGRLRLINLEDPILPNEYRIAFRFTDDLHDFHFAKEIAPNLWSAKAGDGDITEFSADQLLGAWDWGSNNYNRKIAFFAMKRV